MTVQSPGRRHAAASSPTFGGPTRASLGGIVALAALGLASAASGQPAKPNVVIIMSDDAGYADFGFMSQFTGEATQFKTPRLDQLASESKVFTNAYTSAPLCAPSRAGMLTGRYQTRFGFEYNTADTNDPVDGVPTSETLMFERFRQLGYRTGLAGKWHLGVHQSQQPQNQGVDETFVLLQGARTYFTNPIAQPPIWRQAQQVVWQNEASFNGVPNDPVKGRYLTDAFGDEASKFIANNAAGAKPFLLYVPFNAPHTPVNEAKGSDLAQFANSTLTGDRKNVAALTYGMDRNVGEILDRLDDPNQDGSQSDSIRNNTIVIFLNDNGGSVPSAGVELYDNGALRDYKGSVFEGGLRIPMLIRAPGVSPGVVDEVVSSLDIFPTLVQAAGGQQTTPTDGVNLLPLLSGANTNLNRDALFWRLGVDGFAVRKGDWKLVKGRSSEPIRLFQLNADGSGEQTDLYDQNPAIVQDLIREYVDWEVGQDKLRWTNDARIKANRFDEFRMRNDLTTEFNWQWSSGWRNNQDASVAVRLQRYDAAPSTVLVFETRDDASYNSTNNLRRSASSNDGLIRPNPVGLEEFMLNEVRLQGAFGGTIGRSGTLKGIPLMMVKSLAGRQPRIALDANRNASADFTFNVNMDLVLYDDLLLTGNGSGSFAVGGKIRDLFEARGIVKEGTSRVTLTGLNPYRGVTEIRGGELRVDAPAGGLTETAGVVVRSGGRLAHVAGTIATSTVLIEAGGTYAFQGGRLETSTISGSLTNAGGTLAKLDAVGALTSTQNYTQQAGGTLNLRLAMFASGMAIDRLAVGGAATLGGTLDVDVVDLGGGGYEPDSFDSFEILTASGGISGTFSSVSLPQLADPALNWALVYLPTSVRLQVVLGSSVVSTPSDGVDNVDQLVIRSNFGGTDSAGSRGDFSGDGFVDGADFLEWQRLVNILPAGAADLNQDGRVDGGDEGVWRTRFGGSSGGLGDINGNGVVDGADILVWQRKVGSLPGSPGGGNLQAVPEPAAAVVASLAVTALAARRRRQP